MTFLLCGRFLFFKSVKDPDSEYSTYSTRDVFATRPIEVIDSELTRKKKEEALLKVVQL